MTLCVIMRFIILPVLYIAMRLRAKIVLFRIQAWTFPHLLRLHRPVFSANLGDSEGGVFVKIIFGCHDKSLTNVLYQR